MKHRYLSVLLMLCPLLLVNPHSAYAQLQQLKRVALLPLESGDENAVLAEQIDQKLGECIRLRAGMVLVSQDETRQLISDRSLSNILSSTQAISNFTDLTGLDYIIAGKIKESSDGRVEIVFIIFSRDDKEIQGFQQVVYNDESQVLLDLERLGVELSRPQNFSSSDTAVFASLFLPGLGQLQKREPLHALVSVGLVAGAVVYGLNTPKADDFRFDHTKYNATPNYSAQVYDYFVRSQPVSKTEFFVELNEDWQHHLRAEADRRAVKVRKRRASGLFVLSYIINLADAVLLSREKVDTSPFFVSVRSGSADPCLPYRGVLQLQLRLSIRLR